MRVFAGPNGSGKTTIITDLKIKYHFGVYINADDIEAIFRNDGKLDINKYQVILSTKDVQDFFRTSTFSPIKLSMPNLWKFLSVEENQLIISKEIQLSSYIAADIAELLRQKMLESELSFTYETVMSHKGKLSFMAQAREEGYRVYLYFIATNDPDININRVEIRHALNGHTVHPEVIKNRYFKSLQNLKEAVLHTDRVFLFDNSSENPKLLAEIIDGKNVSLQIPAADLPNWFIDYLL